MILLDTDHISILQHAESQAAEELDGRLNLSPDQYVATTSITLEEQSRSWLNLIRRYTDVHQQVTYYAKFTAAFRFFAEWRVVAFDHAAADRFRELRSARIRIGTSDLKIASICLVNNATLLSRNLADFIQIPELRVENWLGPERQ
ncbi:MAG: type II toxin-antitoxin system VapC family toxin [Planctomycetota bacterium]